MKESEIFKTPEQPKKFNWREYLKNPDQMPENLAVKLEGLADIINEGGEEGKEFMADLEAGSLAQPLLSLTGFFRDILDANDRAELNAAIEKCGSKRNLSNSHFIAPEGWEGKN